MISMLKAALKPWLQYAGVPLLDRMYGRRTRVLTYHEVSRANQDNFARQCRWIRKQYHPVSLDDYVSSIETGRSLPPRSVVVTFDDGLLSVYQNGATSSSRTVFRRSCTWFRPLSNVGCGCGGM
jgi:hypothetical protein